MILVRCVITNPVCMCYMFRTLDAVLTFLFDGLYTMYVLPLTVLSHKTILGILSKWLLPLFVTQSAVARISHDGKHFFYIRGGRDKWYTCML